MPNITDFGLWTCSRVHLSFSKHSKGSTSANIFVDINLTDCTKLKHLDLFTSKDKEHSKLVTTDVNDQKCL